MKWLVGAVLCLACGTKDTDLVPFTMLSAEPPICSAVGWACMDDASCCTTMPPTHCKSDGAGLVTKHCQQDAPK